MEKLKPILAKFPEDGRITGVQIKGTLDAHVEDVATFKKAADNAYLPGGAGFDAFMEMSPVSFPYTVLPPASNCLLSVPKAKLHLPNSRPAEQANQTT